RILARRWETPEEYHSRPKDMLTVTLLGRTFTIRMPYEIVRKKRWPKCPYCLKRFCYPDDLKNHKCKKRPGGRRR
ncbi:MAG: hypothetical protein JRD89_18845, partial [Deltaproteobacteria bacterium]|nr:hypothetical protein [Deltaproteobacteria bacterium]